MSKPLVLDPGTTCRFHPSQSGSNYLACKIEGNPLNLTAFAQGVITAERDSFCSNFIYARYPKCWFRASNQTFGCGCAELNNPTLKSAYERSVKNFVLALAER